MTLKHLHKMFFTQNHWITMPCQGFPNWYLIFISIYTFKSFYFIRFGVLMAVNITIMLPQYMMLCTLVNKHGLEVNNKMGLTATECAANSNDLWQVQCCTFMNMAIKLWVWLQEDHSYPAEWLSIVQGKHSLIKLFITGHSHGSLQFLSYKAITVYII
jgi:hypothetical protein